ncbi:hypothetical protein [Methylobacter sp. S3L5C]|nr:hypothetical protein [Methylobacter sp. S3L5C]
MSIKEVNNQTKNFFIAFHNRGNSQIISAITKTYQGKKKYGY